MEHAPRRMSGRARPLGVVAIAAIGIMAATMIMPTGVRSETGRAGASPAVVTRPVPVTPDFGANAPLAVPAAAGIQPSTNSGAARVIRNVPFTGPVDCGGTACSVDLDIYRPAGPGPFPTVVLIRGGPSGLGGRTSLESFASALAASGVLVYNADMRDLATNGGGYPAAFEDVACAVRFARLDSISQDGDGSGVILVGHSFGGYVGSVVALDPDEFTGSCLAGGSGRPDAFVGLAGNYDLSASEVADDLRAFFGGSEQTTAQVRAAGDPFDYANGTPIPVRLLAGTADRTVDPAASVRLNAFLALEQWDSVLTLIPGAGHGDLVQGVASASIGEVMSAVDALQSPGPASSWRSVS